MKKIFIYLIMLLFLIGCAPPTEITNKIIDAKKPIYIAGIGTDGSVTLYDFNGVIIVIPSSYTIARSIIGSGFKKGDIFIPNLKNKIKE